MDDELLLKASALGLSGIYGNLRSKRIIDNRVSPPVNQTLVLPRVQRCCSGEVV